MSQSHRGMSNSGVRQRTEDGDQPVESQDTIHGILAALDDSDCRELLQATAADALTAATLADQCDLPLSTTYRKLELLTEAGLLEERTRLRKSGKHVSEYALVVDSLTVSVDNEGIQLRVSPTSDQNELLSL